jgi:hypothetical protein
MFLDQNVLGPRFFGTGFFMGGGSVASWFQHIRHLPALCPTHVHPSCILSAQPEPTMHRPTPVSPICEHLVQPRSKNISRSKRNYSVQHLLGSCPTHVQPPYNLRTCGSCSARRGCSTRKVPSASRQGSKSLDPNVSRESSFRRDSDGGGG